MFQGASDYAMDRLKHMPNAWINWFWRNAFNTRKRCYNWNPLPDNTTGTTLMDTKRDARTILKLLCAQMVIGMQ